MKQVLTCVRFGVLKAENFRVMSLNVQDLLHSVQTVDPEDAHAVPRGQVLSIRTHPQGPKPRLALVSLLSVCWPRLLRAAATDGGAVGIQEAVDVIHVDHLLQVLRGQVCVQVWLCVSRYSWRCVSIGVCRPT